MAPLVRATCTSTVPGEVARTSGAMKAPLEHRSLPKAADIISGGGNIYVRRPGRPPSRPSPHVLNEMTGSVAGHDGARVQSHLFRRLVLRDLLLARFGSPHDHIQQPMPGDGRVKSWSDRLAISDAVSQPGVNLRDVIGRTSRHRVGNPAVLRRNRHLGERHTRTLCTVHGQFLTLRRGALCRGEYEITLLAMDLEQEFIAARHAAADLA